jgi:hypothetical protein
MNGCQLRCERLRPTSQRGQAQAASASPSMAANSAHDAPAVIAPGRDETADGYVVDELSRFRLDHRYQLPSVGVCPGICAAGPSGSDG